MQSQQAQQVGVLTDQFVAAHRSAATISRRRKGSVSKQGKATARRQAASASSAMSAANLKKILKEKFSLTELRSGQSEVIKSVLSRKHTLAIMPTGAGKSLCYQLPSLLLSGMTIVVSPLISLMKDQKDKLGELHISALELNSNLKATEQAANLAQAAGGHAEIVYVTPERLQSPEFLESIGRTKISLLVIDEAHCITQWGHDFRPAYLGIKDAWRSLGEPTILALTATATSAVEKDIQAQLGVAHLNVIHSGVLRENLHYEAIHVEDADMKYQLIIDLLKNLNGCGVIYAATIKAVNEVYELLKRSGYRATRYHGQLKPAERTQNQDAFMSGEIPIIVATNAFGMGIDKPDLRYVIHFQMPGSLESYYQESGRAGRDGDEARCILIYLKADKRTQSFFLAGKYPKACETIAVYRALEAIDQVTIQQLQAELPHIAKSKVRVILAALRDAKLLKGTVKNQISLTKQGLSDEALEAVAHEFCNRQDADREKLRQMLIYSQTALCRWKMILRYFDQESDWQRCGHCDNCHHESSKLVEVESHA